MARSGDGHDDNLFVLMQSADAPERAARYRREAGKFRQMAQAEVDGYLRESLLALAKEYDDLVAGLTPPTA